MSDLKSCPFCGAKAKLDTPSRSAPGWQVFCPKCETVATPVKATEEEAIRFWNNRSVENTKG